MSWTYDAPSGTYKNHHLSAKIRDAAIPQTEFFKYVSPEDGYGRGKGDTLNIIRFGRLDLPDEADAKLDENVRIPEDGFSISVSSITVSEWGRAVPYSNLELQLTSFNLEVEIQRVLKEQMERVMDRAAANAFKECKIKAIATGVSELTFDTDGTASSQSVVNMNLYHLERMRDYAMETLNMPKYKGSSYYMLSSVKAARGLKDDPSLQKWYFNSSPQQKQDSELGVIENTRIIEVGNTDSLDNTIGASGVGGEAIFFGDDPIVVALVQDPELRVGLPGDFGRSKAVAWYGILEFGEPRPTANSGEARIIHFTSS